MIEVEIRARIKDTASTERNVLKTGAVFVKKVKQTDKVFGRAKDLDSETKIIEGRFSARIRKSHGKTKVELKEIRRTGAGLEFSSEVPTIAQGEHLLTSLDYKEAFTISKIRRIYKYKDFEISIDKVKDLGNFIEIEHCDKSGKNKEKAIKDCLTLLKRIDPTAKTEPRKYGDLMQELINSKNTGSPIRYDNIVDIFREAEKLKQVLRFKDDNLMTDKESSADHAWRVAFMVVLLTQSFDLGIDREKAIAMAVVHNLYEIYSDNIDYRQIARGQIQLKNVIMNEKNAAIRIASYQPKISSSELAKIISEYLDGKTKEALLIKTISKIETLDHLVNCGFAVYDSPELIATYADKAVANFPALTPILKEIKNRLKAEFRKGNFAWNKKYDS